MNLTVTPLIGKVIIGIIFLGIGVSEISFGFRMRKGNIRNLNPLTKTFIWFYGIFHGCEKKEERILFLADNKRMETQGTATVVLASIIYCLFLYGIIFK